MPKHKRNRVTATRNVIVGFIVVIVVLVGAYGLLYSTGVTDSGEISEGSHYKIVEGAARARRGVEVVEYFSYACIHCKNFDPMIEEWQRELPEGSTFRRVHAAYSPVTTLLSKAFFTLAQHGALEQNHMRIFRAIHDRGRQFLSAQSIADYVDGFGITSAEFLRTFNSPRIERAARSGDARFVDMGLTGVPALVVGDRYVINMDVGRVQSLDVALQLVERELAAKE